MFLPILVALACHLGTGFIQWVSYRGDEECDWIAYWITFGIATIAYVGWGLTEFND